MLYSKQVSTYLLFLSGLITSQVAEGHGYLKTPRSRNWVAQVDGVNAPGPASDGKPEQDFCPHCLNTKATNDLCSKGNAATLYDYWNDINGNPMPWDSQATYQQGQEITVESVLTTNHAGHMDMYLCPNGDSPDQECMWQHPLTMVKDELYGGPTDPDYPERGYFKNDAADFKFTYKLPDGVCGEKVLIQWRYITANSCFPPGYKNTAVGDRLQELGWLRASGMSDCIFPYDPTGATGAGKPEQFWNCAEISIECSDPTISPAPTPVPVPTPAVTEQPTPSPTDPPGPAPGYCSHAHLDTTRSECDGQVDGGEWCNENEGQCTGSCNGQWCTLNAPSPPITDEPTPSPSSSPTETPTAQPTSCSDNPDDQFFIKIVGGVPKYMTCKKLANLVGVDDTRHNNLCTKKTDSYNGIGPAQEVCQETCGTCPIITDSPTDSPTTSPTATPTAQPTSCSDNPDDQFFIRIVDGAPKYMTCGKLAGLVGVNDDRHTNLCTKKTDSYDGIGPAQEVCKEACGLCPINTESPTKSPVYYSSSPTKAPTAPSPPSPTPPTSDPPEGMCCSQFFDVCKDNPWCQESISNCKTCNGVFLPDLPNAMCIERFGMCDLNNPDNGGCCYPSTCVSGTAGDGQGQCMYYPPE